ncbi:MAG TPA: hypothetical protein VG841_01940 [Caulobacterales bacterium]|nr:hypothetical protein [Caulobacterales bacterium]
MNTFRMALLATALVVTGAAPATAASAAAAAPSTQAAEIEPAAALRATQPPHADPARTYPDTSDALLQGDLDYLVREARRGVARGDNNTLWPVLIVADDLMADRPDDARTALQAAPGGLQGGLADILEPFVLAAEGHVDRGVERVDQGGDSLPAPMPDVERALVFESANRLQEAAAVYSQMLEHTDLTPPPRGEPTSLEEVTRSLNATRVTHAIYRAALVQHRLGHAAEARRLYGIVSQFAPRSADVERNLARLDAGQPPLEPPLDARRAAGRWMLFVADFLSTSDNINRVLSQTDPKPGLNSTSGALFLQLGIILDPDANDWRLAAANQLVEGGGLDGAQRVIDRIPNDSVFAPDADIVRASIALERHEDAAAVAAAERAAAAAGDRWAVIASAGDVYRLTGHNEQAIASFTRALAMASEAKDRAEILGWRSYAHRFAGDYAGATADMRAALALDPSENTRMLYVSILMDDPAAWRDGVAMARQLFAEQPDSALRLNALGYALIQRPEGLEEGYRLLWRGFSNAQSDYAIVDSLAWAYYLYGAFDQARALSERARDLSVIDPNAEVLDHLGDVYWRLNRRDDAREAWTSALHARPDLPRQRALEQKIARGLTAPAPRRRDLPQVNLPQGPSERGTL